MGEIKAVETMRKFIDDQFGGGHACSQGMAIADNIEAEIADRFMKLPVDADEEPIHIGDEVTCFGDAKKYTVFAVGSDSVSLRSNDGLCSLKISIANIRHIKPRTVEDVLLEFVGEYQYSSGPDYDAECIAKYANEIRELLSGDTR